MKILLIDNQTTLLKKLEDLIPGNEIVHPWNNLADLNPNDFDLIILSGGSRFEIVGNERKLQDEIDLIKNSGKPVIGICYGCELIAEAFGGVLEKSCNRHQGIVDIDIVVKDEMFGEKTKLQVYENHHWCIRELPKEFVTLAKSAHSPEIVKHKDRPIYGFQFHPEQFTDQTEGDEVFLRLFKKLTEPRLSV